MSNPTLFHWSQPTTNTDNTPITAGEITGYNIGIRQGGTAGTYPTVIAVVGASTLTTPIPASLGSGIFTSAIQTDGPIKSAWSAEITFTIAATPNPPTGFGVA
jgi:hypothetical protein